MLRIVRYWIILTLKTLTAAWTPSTLGTYAIQKRILAVPAGWGCDTVSKVPTILLTLARISLERPLLLFLSPFARSTVTRISAIAYRIRGVSYAELHLGSNFPPLQE